MRPASAGPVLPPPGFIYAVGRDITARQEADAERRFHAALLDAVGQAVIASKPDGTITYWNRAAEESYGWTAAEVLGRNVLDVTPAQVSREEAAGILASVRDGRRWSGELAVRRRNGTGFTALVTDTPVVDATGTLVGVVGVSTDVTEQRRVADDLRASEARYQRQKEMLQVVLDHIPAMVVLLDPAGRVAFANREWTRVLGWSSEEARQLDLLAEAYPDVRESARARDFVRAATGQCDDVRMRVRDGRVIDTVWAYVRLSDGSTAGIGQDVTERRRAEQEHRRAQKLEAMGRLAGGVAHDFNNLIQIITASTRFAREHIPPAGPAERELVEIEAAAGRAAALTRQLLAFGRRQVLKPERLDLHRVVVGVERMLQRVIGADVALRTDLQPDLPPVHADAGQLEQVLMNLVLNARDALPTGGTLVIETRTVHVAPNAAGHAPGAAPGTYVALCVRDRGTGMTEETRARVFEPFFTTKSPGHGAGLGLSTVDGIVAQSGGYVQVESAPGVGSAFTVFLPAVEGDVAAGDSTRTARQPPRGTGTILLAEDDRSVRAMVRRLLEQAGYRVLEAEHGARALELLADPAVSVDLVLSDVVMPEMGAGELLTRLRQIHRAVKVLLISGYGAEAVASQPSLPADLELLAKPFMPDELLHRVHAMLGRPAAVPRDG